MEETRRADPLGPARSHYAAQGAAVGAETAPMGSDSRALIDLWPDLPEAVRIGILAMVQASGTDERAAGTSGSRSIPSA